MRNIDAAEDELAYAAVRIGSHDQHVGADVGASAEKRLSDGAPRLGCNLRGRRNTVPRQIGRQFAGGAG